MNLGSVLLRSASATPDAPALIEGAVITSFASLAAEAARLAGAVGSRTEPGDRVAIEIANRREFVVAYLGCLLAGRVAVPLNPGAPEAELARERASVNSALNLDAATVSEFIRTADAIVTPVEVAATDPAVLLFTSGTAGAPKAAILTHGSLAANLEQVQSVERLALRADDVFLGVLPFFHVFGLNVVLGLALRAGGAVVLTERFDPAGTLQLIRDHRVTVVAGVPAVFAAWSDSDESVASDTCSSVRLAVSGAAALDRGVAEKFHARFGVPIYEGYGLTEASPIVSSTAIERAVRPGSIGPALPGVEVRLVDDDGADALFGDPGEIWVRGPNVFAGYWNDADQTARVLTRDGWLRTGDIAVADADGWLTLVDRAKDLIIVSGFNVFPAEVEDALCEHDAIAEAAVVGEPDARSGERVVAFVVAKRGEAEPTSTQLIAHLRHRVARYKIPSRFEMVDALPHTFAGKVLRRELRGADTANPA